MATTKVKKQSLQDGSVNAYKLNAGLPVDGQFLTTDALGNLSWAEGGGTTATTITYEVRNETGFDIPVGSAVYISGGSGSSDHVVVSLASAADEASSSKTFGITAETILNNSTGLVTLEGIVEGIDTSLFTNGGTLWLGDTPGSIQVAPPPSTPSHAVFVGYAVRIQQNNGTIFVKIQNGYELEELHNVLISSPNPGESIIWDSLNGYWVNGINSTFTSLSVQNASGDIDSKITISNGDGSAELIKTQYDQFHIRHNGALAYNVNSAGDQFFGGAGQYGGKFNFNGAVAASGNGVFGGVTKTNSINIGGDLFSAFNQAGNQLVFQGETGASMYTDVNGLRLGVATVLPADNKYGDTLMVTTNQDLHVAGDVIAFSTSLSDKRLKDNIETIPNALDKVSKLRGVSYDWNKGIRKGQKDLGLIAQEVEEVLPELVREKQMHLVDGETYKTVDYEKIVSVLVEAVKELKAQVEELKSN